MRIVWIEPENSSNTGNIARLCAATKTLLPLVKPLGFQMIDKRLQRTEMDYCQQVSRRRWDNWQAFQTTPSGGFGLSNPPKSNTLPKDFLLFGRESAGLPPKLLAQHPDCRLRIPMFHPDFRSLNLANCAAIILYEALRQQGLPNERAFFRRLPLSDERLETNCPQIQ